MKDQKKAARVDLSSMERHRSMTTKQMTEAEGSVLKTIGKSLSQL
jgi:hypothetical protein